jgi:hypothetical protein
MTINYQEIVKKFAADKTDQIIPSSNFAQALVGVQHLFLIASGKIRIISDEFQEEFWKNLREVILEFLQNDPKNSIELVLLQKPQTNNLIKDLINQFHEQFKTYPFPQLERAKKLPNFIVVEPMGFRFEPKREDNTESLVNGVINFGDKVISTQLIDLFEEIKEITQIPHEEQR